MATARAAEVTKLIKQALANDTEIRAKGGKCGFAEMIPTTLLTSCSAEEFHVLPVSDIEINQTSDNIQEVRKRCAR